MDVFLLGSLAIGLILLILILALFTRRKSADDSDEQQPRIVRPRQPVPRRAAGVRNARQRMRVVAPVAADGSDDENEHVGEDENDQVEVGDVGKLGAKKRAKIEAKAERKAQREAAEREREDRRKRELILQEERDKESEKERSEEARKEEAERRALEEKERKEYEEYLKMKEAFSVEEEGYQEHNDTEQENLLQEFLNYIKENKVVVLEDLAGHFRMKTQSVIERIQDLQAAGSLTGVIDDRGKFIYISQSELEAIAKFVRQRGRVSITELAENSNLLINLSAGKGGNAIHVQ